MTGRREEEVRRVFAEAMERPPRERPRWLAETCPDPDVRQEVESLLDALETRGGDLKEALFGLSRLTEVPRGSSPDSSRDRMAEMVGRQLGHYRIVEPIGRGGMGMVFRAVDQRLERSVTLKFLAPAASWSPDSRERFLREARAASALDHPAICTIHEIGETDEGSPYIVMAHVPGETLQERIARRPLPVPEVLDVADQIARGLAHAHERGVVHRDLKASNVMVGDDGKVTILDFGLAKVDDTSLTRTGMVLGTVPYMSPEQIRGQAVDGRADVWGLGVLLYEMLTGRAPFRRESGEATAHAILNDDPEPPTALRSDIPVALDGIVAKALAKDPSRRYQHIDEMPVDLRSVAEGGGAAPVAAAGRSAGDPRRVALRPAVIGIGLGLAAALGGAWLWGLVSPRSDDASAQVRFGVPLPAGHTLSTWWQPLALSPDGRRIAIGTQGNDGAWIHVRDLARDETVRVPGTRGGTDPFFSPDGRWIGFFAEGELRKVEVEGGGIPQTITEAPQAGRGASWGSDGTIVLTQGITTGLLRVPEAGGAAEVLTSPDGAHGEIGHYWPQHLGETGDLLFTVWSAEGFRTVVLPAGSDRWESVLEGGAAARYAPTGHLVFAQMSGAQARPGLLAVPFDRSRREVEGAPVSLLEEPGLAGPNFTFSRDGTLVYVTGGSPAWSGLQRGTLEWRNADGTASPALDQAGFYEAPRLSPEGTRVAVGSFSPAGTYDIWVHELTRGTRTRISLTGSINTFPVWTPDGDHLVFNSSRQPAGLYRKAADGTGEASLLVPRGRFLQVPGSASPDGSLVYTQFDSQGRGDVWVLGSDGEATPLLAAPASERSPAVSPAGDYLAFVSDGSGQDEVYVAPYPGGEPARAVSTGGGREPIWATDGRALFYRGGDSMMVVDIPLGDPRGLFELPSSPVTFGQSNYDVAADGRFLLVRPTPAIAPTRISVVTSWFSELDARVGRSR